MKQFFQGVITAALLMIFMVSGARADNQPPYDNKDPAISENFRNIYLASDKLSLLSTLFNYTFDSSNNLFCIDSPTFCIDAVNHAIGVGTTAPAGNANTLHIAATSNQLVLGTGNRVILNAPTPAGSSRIFTLPDVSASPDIVVTEGAQTINGTKTFQTIVVGTITATSATATALSSSSATITNLSISSATTNFPMSTHILTGLGNGSSATDSAAFGQIKIIQSIFATTAVSSSTTSSTYVNTNLTATITPTSASNKVFVWVSGCLETNVQANNAQLSLKRGSTEVTSGGLLSVMRPAASAATRSNGGFVWIDSPSATTATTYTAVLASADNASTSRFPSNAGETATMLLIEFKTP